MVAFGMAGLLLAACSTASPSPMGSAEAEAAAMELVRGIEAEIEIAQPTLVAAAATADFGIEEGLRRVVIRVVDRMRVRLTLRSEAVVPLAGPPGICLVGPFWNPLDAGLSDRCWGEPDFTTVTDQADQTGGDARLTEGSTTVESELTRGHERCDYAPGEWHLEVALRPVVDGQAFGPIRLPDVTFEVPIEDLDEPLELLPILDTRVCSYPAAVVNRQGEPVLVEP
jgi:hypothetical protein